MEENSKDEVILRKYKKIMNRVAIMMVVFPFVWLIAWVFSLVKDNENYFLFVIIPCILYLLYFNIFVYKCPNCGREFPKDQIFRKSCIYCGIEFK